MAKTYPHKEIKKISEKLNKADTDTLSEKPYKSEEQRKLAEQFTKDLEKQTGIKYTVIF